MKHIYGIIQIGLLILITLKIKKIMGNQEQAAQALQNVSAQLQKIGTETSTLLDKIEALPFLHDEKHFTAQLLL